MVGMVISIKDTTFVTIKHREHINVNNRLHRKYVLLWYPPENNLNDEKQEKNINPCIIFKAKMLTRVTNKILIIVEIDISIP